MLNEKTTGDFLVPISDKKIHHLKDKKFFNEEDFTSLFPKVWFWIFKSAKGKGKTYRLQQRLWDIERKGKKVAVGRYSRDELSELSNAMNNDKDWPFKVKQNQLFSKETGEHKGILFYLKGKGLQRFTSIQFPEYEEILVDEFSPVNQQEAEHRETKNLVSGFIRFCSDVQRGKPTLKVFMFGNNNSDFDPFMTFFEFDFRHKLMVDYNRGVGIANVGDYYIGVTKDTNAFKLTDYDPELKNFFTKNESGELTTDLMPKKLFEKLELKYQIIFQGVNYLFFTSPNDYIAIMDANALYLSRPHYAILLNDVSVDKDTELISRDDDLLIDLILKLVYNNLVYNRPETKRTIAFMLQTSLRFYEEQFMNYWDKRSEI